MSKSQHSQNCTSNIVHRTLFAFAFLLLGSITNAQNTTISYNSTAQPDAAFTVCGVAETNSLKISNGNSAIMTNTSITLHLPPGGTYVAGTITGATESNISNLNAPVFNVPDIAASNNATITYQAMFGCAVIAYQNAGSLTQETADFTYKLNSVTKTQTAVAPPSTYNVVAAALSITSATNTSYTGNVGSSFTQTLSIVNGGLGCASTAYVLLSGQSGAYSFSNPSIGTISNDTLFLATTDMPGGDGKWCNTENMTVTYTVTINNCSNLNRSIKIAWGCNTTNCQPASTAQNSNVIIANNTPSLSLTLTNPTYDFCFTGEQKMQRFRIINTGAGPATNIKFSVSTSQPGSFSSYLFMDTTTAWQVKDKNGTVLGVVNSFSNLGTGNIRRDASCNLGAGIATLTGNLNSITLNSGDSLFIEMYVRATNFGCSQYSCINGIAWLGLRGSLDYKNQCGQGAYNLPYNLFISRAFTQVIGNMFVPSDVTGTAPNNTFNIRIDFSHMTSANHPSGRGKNIFAFPLLGTDILPTVTSTVFGGYTLPVKVINDTMFVGPLPQNVNIAYPTLTIPMQATCGTGGIKNISFLALLQYDSTCSPIIKFGCTSRNINIHCPNPCPKGGATPVNFSLNRITYGLVDNNNDGMPDASGTLDLSKIYDHNSVNGDTLQATWNIKINPNVEPTDANYNLPFNYTYIDFQLGAAGAGQPGTLNAIPNAQVTIYPAGGGAAINCTVSPTILGTKAHYDFASCRSPWVNGDSMVVKALFTTNQYNGNRYNGNNSSGFDLFNTNIEVYSTYAPQATPTTAPINNTTYTCDHFNDYNQMSRIWLSPYIPQNQLITGCTNDLVSYMRQYVRNQEGGLIFPYEYRAFFIPDTMMVQIPHGFVYRSNTARAQGYRFTLNYTIPDADVFQIGDTLYFKNLKRFYTAFGGVNYAGDEQMNLTINFSIDATCDAVGGDFNGNTKTVGIGNGLNTQGVGYGDNTSWYINPVGSTYLTYIYRAPQPVLAGGGTVVTNDGAANWSMQLQNLSNNAPAANSYFYISPVNSFTNIVIKEGSTTLTPDANGFYRLGDLLASANRNFTITANLGRCSLDSFRIYFGNSCTGSYPTTFTASSCQQQAWFKASGFPASLDMTFDKVASGTVDLCTPFSLEAVINSTLVGNLGSETLKVVLPAGVTYVSNSVQKQFPTTSSYTTSVYNPTQNGDTLVFALNSLTGNIGLRGVGALDSAQIKVKFQLQTACGYISGNSISAIVSGTSPCGDAVPKVIKTSSAVAITGASATTQYVITESGANNISTCGSAQTYTFTIKNTGTANPPANDSLTINLSNGLSYVSGSLVGIRNAPSPTAPVQNGNLLRWRIPATVMPGDSMKFTINLAANTAGCGYNTMDIYATQSIVLTCVGNNCSTPVITGRLITDTITTICCVDMQINKTVSTNTVAADANAVYTIAVFNPGPGTATNVVVNDVLPAGVTYVSNTRTRGTWTAPDWTIPTMAIGQRDTIRFTVTANNSTTSAVTVGNRAYIKSINNTTPETNRTNDTSSVNLNINPNCTGVSAGTDQTVCGGNNVTLTGAPTTGAWTALGTNPTGATLGSTTSGVASASLVNSANGNYDFIFTDGACKDTMRVVVRAATTSTTNLSICANQLPYTWNGLTFNAAGTQTAHLTNAAGCDSAATLNLTVNAMPNAGSNQTVTCYLTSTATMNATGTGTWSAASGNPGTATIATPTSPTTTIATFSAAGTYSFIWTNAAGCSSTVTITVGSTCCRAGSTAPLVKP